MELEDMIDIVHEYEQQFGTPLTDMSTPISINSMSTQETRRNSENKDIKDLTETMKKFMISLTEANERFRQENRPRSRSNPGFQRRPRKDTPHPMVNAMTTEELRKAYPNLSVTPTRDRSLSNGRSDNYRSRDRTPLKMRNSRRDSWRNDPYHRARSRSESRSRTSDAQLERAKNSLAGLNTSILRNDDVSMRDVSEERRPHSPAPKDVRWHPSMTTQQSSQTATDRPWKNSYINNSRNSRSYERNSRSAERPQGQYQRSSSAQRLNDRLKEYQIDETIKNYMRNYNDPPSNDTRRYNYNKPEPNSWRERQMRSQSPYRRNSQPSQAMPYRRNAQPFISANDQATVKLGNVCDLCRRKMKHNVQDCAMIPLITQTELEN